MADLGALLGGLGVGGVIGQAIVKLELDSAKYQAEMKAAQAQTATGTSKIGSAFTAMGSVAKAGLAAGAVAVVAFMGNAVRAASDLGEATNKNDVIFGDNAKAIEAWARDGADAFGLSATAALDAAGGFGAMLQTAGTAVDKSAEMSKSLVQLAGDMASFNNIDPTEALEKLRSGLAGEAEPLRRFGVFLSEAAVQQEAYQSGIAKTGEELTEAQKVQARYNIIFEQTQKQQGDFARTADSLPNKIRSLKAEFENVSAEVGDSLLPVLTDLLDIVKDLLPWIEKFTNGLHALAEAGGLVFGPIGVFVKTVSDGVPVTKEMVDVVGSGLVAFESMKAKADLARAGITNLTGGTEAANKTIGQLREELGLASTATNKFAHMSGEALKEWKTETTQSFRAFALNLNEVSETADITRKELREAFQAMEERAREMAQAMRTIAREKWINEDFVKFLAEQGPEFLITFANTNEREQKRMQEQWERSREKTDKWKESFDKVTGVLDEMDNKTTKHTIEVEYVYKGFDPSKPGMGGSTQSAQQR